MNGISMNSPLAMLANLDVGTNPGFGVPSLGQPTVGAGQADLLGFVNMLEVSQGPASPVGENVDQLMEDIMCDDFETKKLAESSDASSDDLLNAMSQQVNAVVSSDASAVKTNSDFNVGRLESFDGPKSTKVSGETMLLGDLKAPKSKLVMPSSEKIETKDVAAWSQAFAQNDIESIDLVDDQPVSTNLVAANAKRGLLSSQESLQMPKRAMVLGDQRPVIGVTEAAQKSESGLRATAKAKPSDGESFAAFVTTKNVEVEPLKLNEGFRRSVPEKAESTLTLISQPSAKDKSSAGKDDKRDGSMDAADMLLGRQILMDSAGAKASNGPLKSGSTLGTPSDMRLSDDSVKMLADKIDGIKESGSSTLRVVVNPNEMGKIEIRVQKINGEIRVHLSSESKEVVRALEESRVDLTSKLSGRLQIASVEIGSEIQQSVAESVRGLSLKSSMPSADVVKLGQSQDSKLNVASSDFSSDFSGFRNPEHREHQGREESRDRGMKKWQGVFEDRESA